MGKTAIGCVGRCKVCGKAILLMATYVDGSELWMHFGVGPDHYAVLSPGVGAYYDRTQPSNLAQGASQITA